MDKALISAALRYRTGSLFRILDDSQIFAVTLSDGTIGYCCCMGNSGQHYSLALYKGAEGFATYLKSIGVRPADELDMFELQCTFHAINCDFENAADCITSKEGRAEIKKVAAEEGIKMCRPKGWPDFFVLDGANQYNGIPDESARCDMTLALEAGYEVADKISDLSSLQILSLGFTPQYAPLDGGKAIPLLTRQPDGTWSWSTTTTPPLAKPDYFVPDFDEPIMAARIKGMRHKGIFQCRITHAPMPVGDKAGRYFPIQLLTLMKPDGELPFMPELMEEHDDWQFDLLNTFAHGLISSGICPASIETDDEQTYCLLLDFCEKTGIILHKTHHLPLLREFRHYMFSMLNM